METALNSYGGCQGPVGGFYGEFSPNLDRLVKAAASKGAELNASKYGLENGRKLQSVLANKIRTNRCRSQARRATSGRTEEPESNTPKIPRLIIHNSESNYEIQAQKFPV